MHTEIDLSFNMFNFYVDFNIKFSIRVLFFLNISNKMQIRIHPCPIKNQNFNNS